MDIESKKGEDTLTGSKICLDGELAGKPAQKNASIFKRIFYGN